MIRRVSFDLTGLPPAPEQVKAFVSDESPDAYEKLVDGLFNSPRYGERWARVWLDLARYADSKGYEADRLRTIRFGVGRRRRRVRTSSPKEEKRR